MAWLLPTLIADHPGMVLRHYLIEQSNVLWRMI